MTFTGTLIILFVSIVLVMKRKRAYMPMDFFKPATSHIVIKLVEGLNSNLYEYKMICRYKSRLRQKRGAVF